MQVLVSIWMQHKLCRTVLTKRTFKQGGISVPGKLKLLKKKSNQKRIIYSIGQKLLLFKCTIRVTKHESCMWIEICKKKGMVFHNQIQIMISLLIFAKNITAVMMCPVCFSHLISVCPISPDFHLVLVLSARFLPY